MTAALVLAASIPQCKPSTPDTDLPKQYATAYVLGAIFGKTFDCLTDLHEGLVQEPKEAD